MTKEVVKNTKFNTLNTKVNNLEKKIPNMTATQTKKNLHKKIEDNYKKYQMLEIY